MAQPRENGQPRGFWPPLTCNGGDKRKRGKLAIAPLAPLQPESEDQHPQTPGGKKTPNWGFFSPHFPPQERLQGKGDGSGGRPLA